MKVLLTGFMGFIGKHVYEKLAAIDVDLYIVSRTQHPDLKNFYTLDILDHQLTTSLIEKIKPDVLIHLAWDVTHGEFWNSEKNVLYADASINLFKAFIENDGKKIIAAGTCSEYARSASPVCEEEVVDSTSLTFYGKEKRRVFDYLSSLKSKGFNAFTWIRIFGIFGLGENQSRLFPLMVKSIKSCEEFSINNPNLFLNYIYVEDLAHFIVECINKPELGPINIGSKENIAIADLYETIKKYLATNKIEIVRKRVNPDPFSHIPVLTKLNKNGFEYSLEEQLHQIKKM